MNDPIVNELRQARDRIAARWGYDLDRLADHLERKRKREELVLRISPFRPRLPRRCQENGHEIAGGRNLFGRTVIM